jgi:hypothetical protein
MSEAGELQTVAFGDLGTGIWGALLAAAGQPPLLCLGAVGTGGAGGATTSLEPRLDGGSAESEWLVGGEGVELVIAPAGEPVSSGTPESPLQGFDQLCRVRGSLVLDGAGHEISVLGCRGQRSGMGGYESLRAVSAWFEPEDGLAVAAFRPRRSKGQEADLISAAVLDSESSRPVEDPRLSTTYTEAGWPARASLELWLASEDEETSALRRATGVAAGSRLQADWGERQVRAELFRWGSRGRDGAGVYVLATTR